MNATERRNGWQISMESQSISSADDSFDSIIVIKLSFHPPTLLGDDSEKNSMLHRCCDGGTK